MKMKDVFNEIKYNQMINKVKILKIPKQVDQYCDICKMNRVDSTSYMVIKNTTKYYICLDCMFQVIDNAFHNMTQAFAKEAETSDNVPLFIHKKINPDKFIGLKRE